MTESIPAPRFQPGSITANEGEFSSSEIPWWDNGKWGECGYAVLNPGGKPSSGNETMRRVVNFIGQELFVLMHKPDVRFKRPFNLAWLRDFNKMIVLGMKRLGDISVSFTNERSGDANHAINTPDAFTVYPVPFHGKRIRQEDAKYWCGELLILMSEMVQHSDNDFDNDITDFAVGFCQKKLRRIQADMAMKYFGFSREQIEAPTFEFPLALMTDAAYKPDDLFTNSEMTQERMPDLWWPEANDLTPINGIPMTVAKMWSRRWPGADVGGDGGAEEAAFPGDGTGATVRQIRQPGT